MPANLLEAGRLGSLEAVKLILPSIWPHSFIAFQLPSPITLSVELCSFCFCYQLSARREPQGRSTLSYQLT